MCRPLPAQLDQLRILALVVVPSAKPQAQRKIIKLDDLLLSRAQTRQPLEELLARICSIEQFDLKRRPAPFGE
jgi:hypothetical protein